MKMSVKVEKKLILELTEEEYYWLKALMQNPFPTQNNPTGNPQLEDEFNREMRRRFWDALQALEDEVCSKGVGDELSH